MTGSLPDQVVRAQRLAEAAGFPLTREQAGPGRASACLPGVGRFLATLAAGCGGGTIAELGTGVGVGTAWLSGAMPAGCLLVTVEIDERLASAAREFFAADRRVDVVTGDALAVVGGRGPFDLIFADCGVRDDAQFDALVDRLAFGGRIVMDDVTPMLATAGEVDISDDAKRRFFASARLVSTEVVLPDLQNSLLVGTRVA